jgi:hypothetical protein
MVEIVGLVFVFLGFGGTPILVVSIGERFKHG